MNKRKPCNHRNRYNVGYRMLDASPKPPVRREVLWCHVCGAIHLGLSWMYPARAIERKAKPATPGGRKR